MPTSSSSHPPDWIVRVASAVDAISGWTLSAITIASAAVLFSPFTAGIDLSSIRQEYSSWLFVTMVFSGLLTIMKLARVSSSVIFRKKKKSFVLTCRPMLAYWSTTKQADDSYVTQIAIDCDVLNLMPCGLKFHAINLISPRVSELDIIHRDISLFRENQNGKNFILPAETEWVRLLFMVRKKLGKNGMPLKAVIEIVDSLGKKQRINLKLRPA